MSDLNITRAEIAALESSKPGTTELAQAYLNFAKNASSQEDEAKLYFRKALQIYERYARKSVALANAYGDFARFLLKRDECSHSSRYFHKALKIFEQEQKASPDMAKLYMELAHASYLQDHHKSACRSCRKALKLQEESNMALDVENTYYILGSALQNRSSFKESRDAFEKTQQLLQKKYEAGNLGVAIISIHLMQVQLHLGATDEARRCFETASAIVGRYQESQSVHVGFIFSNLGYYRHGVQRNLCDARRFYQKSLNINELHSPVSVQTAGDYFDLGLVSHEEGNWNEAKDWYRKALAVCEGGELLEKSPYFQSFATFVGATAHFGMGRVLDDEGKFEQSLVHYEKALGVYQRLGTKRIMNYLSFDPRALPTIQQVEQKVRLNPFRLLSVGIGMKPGLWCHVLSNFRNDVQATYFVLREQPHLVE